MSWNYRVLKCTFLQGKEYHDERTDEAYTCQQSWERFAIHEVYYDEETGKPCSYTLSPIVAAAESESELKETLALMAEAHEKPVLTPREFFENWRKDEDEYDDTYYD